MADGTASPGTVGPETGAVPPEPPPAAAKAERKARLQLTPARPRWKRWALRAGIGFGALLALLACSLALGTVRWRARLLLARARGEFSEIPIGTFIRWLKPGSSVDLRPLLETRSLAASIRNEFTDESAALAGMHIYADNCARCHGEHGTGAAGPNLINALGRMSDWTFFATVKWGRPGTLMLPQPLTAEQIWSTLTHVRGLIRDSDAERSARANRYTIDVAPAAVARSSEDSGNWLTYAGGYEGHRHSHLTAISKRNVGELRLAWTAQFRSSEEELQGSPLVAGGLLFVPGASGEIVALDAANGARVWDYGRPTPPDLVLCCGTGNRGVALMGGTIFAVTLDAHLIALDATTGHVKWDTTVANYRDGYSLTSAPLAIGDRVVVGASGGDIGATGFLAAFATSDGHQLWRFDTVPGPGQPGHETWPGDTWKTGGAAPWLTGAYDKDLGLIYWGVGNAAPVYNAGAREGDNLYSMSALAIDAATGKLRWYFQFTPNDAHDWDSAQQPIVADITQDGQRVPALVWANRNGFFYGLDRRDGKFLFAKPFVKQNWAGGFDPKGRPIKNPGAQPTANGTLVWPWVGGATSWQPPSYDPARGLVYVPTISAAGLFYVGAPEAPEHGHRIIRGGASRLAENQPASISIKAISAATGDMRWETELEHGFDIPLDVGGVLTSDGGLAFIGHRDNLLALDADTGKERWRLNLGGGIKAGPIAYAVDNRQYIAVMAGRSLFAFSLPEKEGERARAASGSSGR